MSRRRIVVVGDLNGSLRSLRTILRGTRLIDRHDHWTGGAATLVQMGDIFNRGDHARHCIGLLRSLTAPARSAGGAVHVLLGNHEVLVARGLEGYSTIGEYLSFATTRQRESWSRKRTRAITRLVHLRDSEGYAEAFAPRFARWELENVPGKHSFRRALSRTGRLGRWLRSLPVAIQLGDIVLVHAGLTTAWAERGIERLNELAADEWRRVDRSMPLKRSGLFRAVNGPLWDRSLSSGRGNAGYAEIRRSLRVLGARRIVVGHTRTETLPSGSPGRIHLRFGGRLVHVDVGLSETRAENDAALIVQGRTGIEWRPDGRTVLWRE